MSVLQIKRSDGLAEFEAYLSKPSTFQKALLLPKDIGEGGGLGNSVAYCQFLLTWARKSKLQDIKTYLEADDFEAFETFTARVHGLSAAYFSKRLLAYSNKGEGDEIRIPVLRAAKPRLEAMSRGDFQESGRGPEVEFIFIQDAPNQFHGSVYTKTPTPTELMDRVKHGELIRSHRELNRLLELCFDHLHVSREIQKLVSSCDSVFGALLSELFRNTAEHGSLDIHGGRLKENLRCIRVATTLINREKLAQKSVSSTAGRQAADRYFAAIADRRSEYSRAKVRVLELSVFDSGQGFAATLEGCVVLDAEKARQAVARCFRKHQSAKIAPLAGEGLFKIMGLLKILGGFIRVRTSNVEVFHGSIPGDSTEIDPDSFVYGSLAPVEGTVVTICIPIAY
jgi:hypothetical protein